MTCAHGMPTPATCVDCMDDDGLGPAPVTPVEGVHSFEARYPGRCDHCDDPIAPGDLVAKMTDDSYWLYGCVERWTDR